jgi:carboxyl-terminal processing protease
MKASIASLAVAMLSAVTLLLAGGCSRGGDAYFDGDEVASVQRFMSERYLYAAAMPAADLSALTTAEQALAALRVNPPDRFSYVANRRAYQAFYDDGRALGLGVGLLLDGDRLRLRFVHPTSPAAAGGLQRGDAVTAIGGIAVADLLAQGGLSEALGPARQGYVLSLDMLRGDDAFAVEVAKDWHEVAAVLDARVIDAGFGPVGYISLYTFAEPAREAWRRALEPILAAGARTLVVDLRDNGGGRVAVAAEIAASLASPPAAGAPFAVLRHNEQNRHRNRTVALPESELAGRIERVAWITSARSCSASEIMVAGLAPYAQAFAVGRSTCGKPIGASPVDLGEKVLNAVTFSAENAVGYGGWFGGLEPGCIVSGETLVPWGDPSDAWLAAALAMLGGGGCPGPSAQEVVPLSRERMLVADPTPDGLAGETGLR